MLALLVALFDPLPEALTGAARASDGDSLRLGSERVRLLGIDAPELDQTCSKAGGAQWPCGEAARTALSGLLKQGAISCAPDGRDRYGRILAHCTADGRDLGRAIVEAGLATADLEYKAVEVEARLAGRGIWQGTFDSPRDWRDRRGIMIEFDLVSWIRGWWSELWGRA
ncbi:MAG: thermonuclease family protein [Devosia sp.]